LQKCDVFLLFSFAINLSPMVPVVMNFFSRQSTTHDVGPTVSGT